MSDVVLFVFEGSKTEPSIFKEISKKHPLGSEECVISTFENCFYDLWAIIDEDPDLDIVELIRERNLKNKAALENYRRSEISQVYFFFDLDSHDKKYTESKVRKLLGTFSNETENGALFISYPMVESLRHFNSEDIFYEKTVCCIENIGYKNIVHTEGHNKYKQIHKLSQSDLNDLLRHHIIKSNYICGIHASPIRLNDFSAKKIKYVSQSMIFSSQVENFINEKSEISILSGFPLFLHQYFGSKIFEKLKESNCNQSRLPIFFNKLARLFKFSKLQMFLRK